MALFYGLTSLAEWAAHWKENHPDDFLIQHYIGSTSESADWQGLVRRVLSELKRAFDIAEEVPIHPEAMRTAMQELVKIGFVCAVKIREI